jgi:hypothetical protein
MWRNNNNNNNNNNKNIIIIIIIIINQTENGILPGGSGTTVRHNTQKYTYHTK